MLAAFGLSKGSRFGGEGGDFLVKQKQKIGQKLLLQLEESQELKVQQWSTNVYREKSEKLE